MLRLDHLAEIHLSTHQRLPTVANMMERAELCYIRRDCYRSHCRAIFAAPPRRHTAYHRSDLAAAFQ